MRTWQDWRRQSQGTVRREIGREDKKKTRKNLNKGKRFLNFRGRKK